MRNIVYTIKVNNWSKYNSSLKKGHKATLISNNFCSDGKLGAVPVTVRWLFLGILLTCGDHTRDTVEMSEKSLRDLLESSWSVQRALEALQSLQLLSYDKNELLLNRIEKNRKEKKRIPVGGEKIKDASQPPKSAAPEKANSLVALYCDRWKSRYKTETAPPVMPADAKRIKTLMQQVGHERASQIIEAYLQMPDQWFVTKRHDIATMLGGLNAITQFIDTGKIITRKEIQTLENKTTNKNLLDMIEEGTL